MKKALLIGLVVALALIIIGGAGVVYAQVRGFDRNITAPMKVLQYNDRNVRPFVYGPGGMMGEYGYGPGDMMDNFGPGNFEPGYGPHGMMGGDGYGYGPGGVMGGRSFGFGPGMMGRQGFAQGEGPMHDYMISAFADAVGLTADEVETRLENGETIREIAVAQGKSEADLPDLINQVRQAALDQAVAAGVITQAQADLMLEHMGNYGGPGFGPGYGHEDCPMWDEQQLP